LCGKGCGNCAKPCVDKEKRQLQEDYGGDQKGAVFAVFVTAEAGGGSACGGTCQNGKNAIKYNSYGSIYRKSPVGGLYG
jgi:hypothetical protein